MNNPLKRLKKELKSINKPQVKLKFSACGEILIDGLPFAFGVESDGISSEQGLTVSLSGEAVDKGRLTFDTIELYILNNEASPAVKKLEAVTKKDGKKIYRARFPEVKIPTSQKQSFFSFGRRLSENEFLQRLSSEISFKTVPHYKGAEEAEVMITVYPNENPLNGLAVSWKNCTSDKDWFVHNIGRRNDK
ncbi:hypothetical protein [Ruminococcus sp. Marseille-P6503]|uniref:hypothetical protein n=1 Tax=Ruminococcus sp. Marseille-P6503 TaxID=2364796 RepID=UPI000F524603|nr:hypothetical protein [Ruminococcus sp. Marseille-P6503]